MGRLIRPPGPLNTWSKLLLVALVFALGLLFRLTVVQAWHVPAGDGMDYYALSQELRLHGRFAYGPWPAPLSYARMPGYPLFLAYLAVHAAPLAIAEHVVRATLANVVLDAGTALLVYLVLREQGVRRAVVGAVLVFICPLLVLLSCYGLGETLATFLTTLAVYLLARAMQGNLVRNAVLAGVVLGLGMLTRADTLTLAPAVLLAFYWARGTARRRLLAFGLCLLMAAAVFAPWPLRNLARFDHAYPAAWYWRSRVGTPLPMGFIRWARTFCAGRPNENFVDLMITVGGNLDAHNPTVLQPAMYDSAAEKQRVAALFAQYNREHLSPAVDAGFTALAAERERRAPLRTFVELPLRRLLALWSSVPEHELPMRVGFLHLPEQRSRFALFDNALFIAALLGAARLFGRRAAAGPPAALYGRRLAVMLFSCMLLRSVVLSALVAIGLTQRHIVEVFPMLITLAAAL